MNTFSSNPYSCKVELGPTGYVILFFALMAMAWLITG